MDIAVTVADSKIIKVTACMEAWHHLDNAQELLSKHFPEIAEKIRMIRAEVSKVKA